MFPQLIAGPIVRYCDIEASLPAEARRADSADFCYGIKRFIFGLGKKVIGQHDAAHAQQADPCRMQAAYKKVVILKIAQQAQVEHNAQRQRGPAGGRGAPAERGRTDSCTKC